MRVRPTPVGRAGSRGTSSPDPEGNGSCLLGVGLLGVGLLGVGLLGVGLLGVGLLRAGLDPL
ncbi:hypothetical protein ACIGNX_18030 [Actinosynnema sp. NPDC053489]|uniref:hypothetical protein n=1 Tax=Actinosynnema sp. NPDC053489 TaxID=3363916 RepID=UPI0037C5810C